MKIFLISLIAGSSLMMAAPYAHAELGWTLADSTVNKYQVKFVSIWLQLATRMRQTNRLLPPPISLERTLEASGHDYKTFKKFMKVMPIYSYMRINAFSAE